VAADAEQLPFRGNLFQRVECDAVLEHVRRPNSDGRNRTRARSRRLPSRGDAILPSLPRVSEGLPALHAGWIEGVGRRFRAGRRRLANRPHGDAAVFAIEYAKLLLPGRAWRGLVHGILGWLLFPLRYLDLLLLRLRAPGASATIATSGCASLAVEKRGGCSRDCPTDFKWRVPSLCVPVSQAGGERELVRPATLLTPSFFIMVLR